ncbi:MAG: hypothetical protein M0R48_07230 [Candidatus Omnitrophica bacterium]|jgi:hypothetical protein|nr:hypothetical protein [Candidatus Omnitrophota bacterium]
MFTSKKLINYRTVGIGLGLSLLCMLYLFVSQLKGICENNKYPFTNEQRDPFSPLITETGQLLVKKNIGPAGLVLKGIIYSKDGSVAIIGDEVFKESDIIDDYRVMKISRKKVILQKGKEVIILKLEENNENIQDNTDNF